MSDIKELKDEELEKVSGGVLTEGTVNYIISSLESILVLEEAEPIKDKINKVIDHMKSGSYMLAYDDLSAMSSMLGYDFRSGNCNNPVNGIIYDMHDVLYFEFIADQSLK